MLVVPAGADLHRHRQGRDRVDHLAYGLLGGGRIAQERRARPVAADFLHRAAHVDVDCVDGPVFLDRDARTASEDFGIVPEDLDRERALAGRPLEVAEGLVSAVHEPMAGDHLGVGDRCAHLPAEQAEGPVRHARQGSEEVSVGELQRPEAYRPHLAGTGRGSGALAITCRKRRVLGEGCNAHLPDRVYPWCVPRATVAELRKLPRQAKTSPCGRSL